jgi:hypothetical protein
MRLTGRKLFLPTQFVCGLNSVVKKALSFKATWLAYLVHMHETAVQIDQHISVLKLYICLTVVHGTVQQQELLPLQNSSCTSLQLVSAMDDLSF